MEIRLVRPEEQKQADRVDAVAFVMPMPEKSEWTGCTWGCFSDAGVLESVATDWPYTVYYDGHPVKMGGVGSVASLPEARLQGGVRSLISEILRRDQENGVVFSALYPFSHTYYRKYGYEICSSLTPVSFPTKALRGYRHHVMEVQPIHDLGDTEALTELQERFSARYNMAVKRAEFGWKRILSEETPEGGVSGYMLTKYGQVQAYVFFRPQTTEGRRRLWVTDFAYEGRDGLRAMMGFLYRLAPQYKEVRMMLPPDLPLDALISEPHEIKGEPAARSLMVRLLDIEQGLSGLRHPCGDWQCTIRVRDDFLPHNSGCYQMTCSGGELEVLRVNSDVADLAVSIQTLTQLCLGYYSLEMALIREDTVLYQNQELLDRLFVRKPIYMADGF